MKNPPIVRTIASIGHVIFSILQVFSAIGAAGILIAVLSLSFLPQKTITVTFETNMKMDLNLRSFFPEDWDEIKKEFNAESIAEGATVTDDGISVEETSGAEKIENRIFSLMLIPTMVTLLIQFFLFLFLSRLCKWIKEAPFTPFRIQPAEQLKSIAITLFILAAAPTFCSSLIAMFTKVSSFSESSFDMGLVLWGLLALALSHIFRFGATLVPSISLGQTPPQEQPPQNNPPQTEKNPDPPPASDQNQTPSDQSGHHPDAF